MNTAIPHLCDEQSPRESSPALFPVMANRPVHDQPLTPYRELYAQGVRLFQIDATFSDDLFHPDLRAWKAPDVFDYSYQENYWRRLLEIGPEARFCLRVSAASPSWWDQQHRGELQRYADGSLKAEFQRTRRHTLPSLASLVWREAACGAFRRFLIWLEDSGWSERIWGLFLAYGITWEWGILGTDRFPDYSPCMQRRFREWLRENYRDETDLRRCWGNPDVTFESAEIPSQNARQAGSGDLRTFPRDRAAADFQNCLSDVNCDYLLALGGIVRQVAGSRYRLGAFYGYTLTAREHTAFTARYGAGGLAGGHHAFGKFLRSGLFDFNASPYAYADRTLGQGCLIQHFPRASCQNHGLHIYEENDLRTVLVAGLADDRTISIGQAKDLQETLQYQKWALAQALCHGTSYWWTELSGWIGPYRPNYDHPEILRELSRARQTLAERASEARAEPAEIALIIDERSIAALSLGSKLFKREVYDQLAAWSWSGAPFDVWLAEDINAGTARPIKLAYVFSPAPSAELRERLRAALCRGGKTVWWAPWTGTLTDSGRSELSFESLTGHQGAEKHRKLRRRDFGSWASLYGSCSGLPAEALSEIARQAGVRIYGEAPLHVMKGQRFLALQSNRAMELPVSGEWREVFRNRELPQDPVLRLERNETVLLEKLGVAAQLAADQG